MIRAAAKNDLDSVYKLIRQLSSREFTKEQFRDCYLFNLEKGRVLVYETDNVICGCLIFNIHYHLHFSRKTAEIVNLIVDENARNLGIGKKLLAAFEKIAVDNNCAHIEVSSNKHRTDAHRFYERESFVCDHCKFKKQL